MTTKAEADRIWAEVQSNLKRLDACVGPHGFVDATPEKKFNKTWACALCEGTVHATERHWYELGLKHGKRAAGDGGAP